MQPFVADPDFKLYVGDVREVLAQLPAESVDCVVTSPPYWGLRDYGTDGQIGLEATPELFVAEMVAVFREVRRVLAPHGTLWLNLGDSYSHGGNGSRDAEKWPKQSRNDHRVEHRNTAGGKPKDLVGIPWRVAFALQADGWYLRADIIWSKSNPMPESVTDRPTKAHEYVFLLSKQPRYFFDQEAVREPHTPDGRIKTVHDHAVNGSHENYANMGTAQERWPNGGRNVRSVWEIATQPYADAHFATFPEALPERCIKAGTPESVCLTCGEPRVRVTSIDYENPGNRQSNGARKPEDHRASGVRTMAGGKRLEKRVTTEGFTDCGHGNYRTGVVLDPFMGSGTTARVARRLGRHAVGVELNPEYAALCARRLQQLSLLADDGAAA